MSEELLYTSAPKGLKPGSRGFCTVQATAGMPPAIASLLESLSGYRHVAAPGDPANPVVWRHVVVTVAGQRRHILSRLADAGADYTGRSNKLVHHLALEPAELNAAGPAWSQQQAATHDRAWSGTPSVLNRGRALAGAAVSPSACDAWRRVTGDAGWGGFLAQRLFSASNRPICVIYPPHVDPLELIAETIALLPERDRWRATYTTYHTNLPPGVECAWRFLPDASTEAIKLRKRPDVERLDLASRLGAPTEGPWIEAGRTGRRPTASAPPTAAVGASVKIDVADELPNPAAAVDWESDLPTAPPPPPRAQKPRSGRQSHGNSISAWVLAAAAVGVLVLLGAVPALIYFSIAPTAQRIRESVKASTKTVDVASASAPESLSPAPIDETTSQDGPDAPAGASVEPLPSATEASTADHSDENVPLGSSGDNNAAKPRQELATTSIDLPTETVVNSTPEIATPAAAYELRWTELDESGFSRVPLPSIFENREAARCDLLVPHGLRESLRSGPGSNARKLIIRQYRSNDILPDTRGRDFATIELTADGVIEIRRKEEIAGAIPFELCAVRVSFLDDSTFDALLRKPLPASPLVRPFVEREIVDYLEADYELPGFPLVRSWRVRLRFAGADLNVPHDRTTLLPGVQSLRVSQIGSMVQLQLDADVTIDNIETYQEHLGVFGKSKWETKRSQAWDRVPARKSEGADSERQYWWNRSFKEVLEIESEVAGDEYVEKMYTRGSRFWDAMRRTKPVYEELVASIPLLGPKVRVEYPVVSASALGEAKEVYVTYATTDHVAHATSKEGGR